MGGFFAYTLSRALIHDIGDSQKLFKSLCDARPQDPSRSPENHHKFKREVSGDGNVNELFVD